MMGYCFGPKNVLKLVELLSKQVLMRITGRMEKTGDKIYFLGRVIERTARGYSVEANPKYMGNVINVCQERTDVMYSVKETARKITCPTESDEMNLKRIVRYLKALRVQRA